MPRREKLPPLRLLAAGHEPHRTLLLSSFHAIVREIGLQADLQIGAASEHSLEVLLDIQQVIAVCLCALPDIHPARIGKKRANPPDEIVKNHFFMEKSPLNQRTGCPAKLWRHGWCIGLLTLASHHAQNPTKAGLPRAVRVAAGVDRSAALNELKSICFFWVAALFTASKPIHCAKTACSAQSLGA
jgi:hypothetical protein